MSDAGWKPDASFDGGDLDCGNGLLLLIRKHLDPLPRGGLLEIRSCEISVREDLPAWCRMTSNELVHTIISGISGAEQRFLVCKGSLNERNSTTESEVQLAGLQPKDEVPRTREAMPIAQPLRTVLIPSELPTASPAPKIPPLAVMGIGSWPRPRWLVNAVHERLEGRMSETEFQEAANDAVRLVIQRQLEAGVDVVTDGEQRRDNYASFVGGLLDNCQLIPLSDLLPYVDDPEKFAAEMKSLDVPAHDVRHPAVFGPLGRSRPLALHEFEFASSLTKLPIKVALPGPYLLTRTMWMECISDRAYRSREALAADIVRVLREELHFLLRAGVTLVQFDEPVLTEVAFAQPSRGRTFMCGALGEKLPTADELQFTLDLYRELTRELPLERIGLHVCRGNWTRDESVALSGSYVPLLDFLQRVPVGNYFLELCTPRAGELTVLANLPADRRVGIGVVNQKHDAVESIETIMGKIEQAVELFGIERVMLTPDCGFATFADRPLSSDAIAAQKLAAINVARNRFLSKFKS
jgi:5-methyltetrahydropteroyltriglutamate--homocysteine methyltransferase